MKLICGIGVNDMPRGSISYIDSSGKRVVVKFYSVWANMIQRCYLEKIRSKYMSYENTTVCDDWLLLSNFKLWFDVNYVEGWHLDKDLLNTEVHIYSPDTCRFVPRSLNNLFTDMKANRGKYKIGVSYSIEHKKFRASLNFGFGNQCHLGYFETEDQAHNCYMREKVKFVLSEMQQYIDAGVCPQLIANIKKDPKSRIIRG